MEQPEFYEALGRTIQVLRTDRGLDRKDLAEAAGISYSYLAGIENGKKQPSSQVLLDIAAALDLRSHELMGAAEERVDRRRSEKPAPPPAAARPAPSQRREWFHEAGREPESEAAEYADFYAAPPAPSPTREPQRSSPRRFVEQMTELAERLTQDDHELLLETARRLAELHGRERYSEWELPRPGSPDRPER